MAFTDEDIKVIKVNRMREAINALKDAKDAYLDVDMHVEAMAIDAMLVSRIRQHDFYIAKHFPITERKE